MKDIQKTKAWGEFQKVRTAQRLTAKAKAVKAWRLNKRSKQLQKVDIPKGYLIATESEIRDIEIEVTGDCPWWWMKSHVDFSKKYVWCLHSNVADYNGKMEINFVKV